MFDISPLPSVLPFPQRPTYISSCVYVCYGKSLPVSSMSFRCLNTITKCSTITRTTNYKKYFFCYPSSIRRRIYRCGLTVSSCILSSSSFTRSIHFFFGHSLFFLLIFSTFGCFSIVLCLAPWITAKT